MRHVRACARFMPHGVRLKEAVLGKLHVPIAERYFAMVKAAVPIEIKDVSQSIACQKAGIIAHLEMQMRSSGMTGITDEPQHLARLHAIAGFTRTPACR